MALALGLALSSAATATPTGPSVVSGNVQIQQNGATLQIQSHAPKSIINWQSFSIAAGETASFTQPSASSVVLNRVVGSAPSQIFGSLQSNGGVYLINPSGILLGAGVRVNTATFVATTANVSDASFLAGNPFPGTGAGSTLGFTGELSMVSGDLNIGPDGITATGDIVSSGALNFTTSGGTALLGDLVTAAIVTPINTLTLIPENGAAVSGVQTTAGVILAIGNNGGATSTGGSSTTCCGDFVILSSPVELSAGGSLRLITGGAGSSGAVRFTTTGVGLTTFDSSGATGSGIYITESGGAPKAARTATSTASGPIVAGSRSITATAGGQGVSVSAVTGTLSASRAGSALQPRATAPRVAVNLQKREPLY